MSDLRVAILRRVYRVAYRLLQIRALVLRRKGPGVKCLLTHKGEVLLVRHTYGPRQLWQIPGGAPHRGEMLVCTAAREMEEELGLGGLDWRELVRTDLRLGHISVQLTCFHAEMADPTVRPDPIEIEQARWFGYDDLPRTLSNEEQRLLGLLEDRE
jgi:ADP-ribose pyrophosphatase YjhB (NUDIX family)